MKTILMNIPVLKAYCLIIVLILAVGGCYKTEVIPCNTCNSCMVIFAGKEVNINPQSVVCGSHALKPENPEREYYDFKGWFTDNDTYLNEWNFETDIVTQDTTLYAKWERNTLEGTRWKLVGIVDVETNEIEVLEPKDCEICYILIFETDTALRCTFGTYTLNVHSFYIGIHSIDFESHSFNITSFGVPKGRCINDVFYYTTPFWDRTFNSFSLKENELKLYCKYDNKEKYMLYKSF